MKTKAQIWLETVIYTLIGLSIISLILAVALPQIKEKKDCSVIEQSKTYILDELSQKIEDLIYYGSGNVRDAELKISQGKLTIDAGGNKIIFETETSCLYSQLDSSIKEGEISILTKKKNKNYIVSLSLEYQGKLDLTFGAESLKSFQASSIPYFLAISNKGKSGDLINIDFAQK